MVICQGCGKAFDVPEGYGRNKIQCPGCGVICAVPADAERKPARAGAKAVPAPVVEDPAFEDPAVIGRHEPEPVPLFDDEPAPKAPAPVTSRNKKEMLFPCRRCGELIRAQRECPTCDAPESPVLAVAAHTLELDDVDLPPGEDFEEDASPYLFADKDLPICPKCRKEMPEGAVMCAACGFNRRTRRKHARTYQPIARVWETDLTLRQRLMWLAAGQGFHWFCAALGVATGTFDSPWPFVVTWPLLTAVLLFLLGTYDRIEIVRDTKGRAKVTKMWRVFFVPTQPVTTEVRGFEGVTTGQWHDAGFLEWFVFLSLLCNGLIPGLIWFYVAIYKVHFHVALAIDHGHSDVYIYRGRSQEQMNDIADALCDASGLKRLG